MGITLSASQHGKHSGKSVCAFPLPFVRSQYPRHLTRAESEVGRLNLHVYFGFGCFGDDSGFAAHSHVLLTSTGTAGEDWLSRDNV